MYINTSENNLFMLTHSNIPLQYLHENDIAALANDDEEGGQTPLLLDSLDLALWTSMFITTTTDLTKTMVNIKYAQTRLDDLLIQDEIEATKSIGLSSMIEETLKLANSNALEANSSHTTVVARGDGTGANNTVHPLLAKLKISSIEMDALEDLTEDINSLQVDKTKQTMVITN